MRLRSRRALVGVLGLLSCTRDGTGPEDPASLALAIAFATDVQMAPDAGRIHIEGPTPRTVSIQPGQTITIDGLTPGNYTVAVEGLRATQLESFGETTVTVVAGENRQANITLRSFIPDFINAPPEVQAGTPFNVQFGAVQGAGSYVVEYSASPDFAAAQSVTVNGTTTSITIQTPGTYLFRVRARNRFNTLSHASAPSAGTEIRTPTSAPEVTSYDVTLGAGATCAVGFRDIATTESVAYTDADGDFPTGSPLAESASQAAVESGFRFEGETNWTRFFAAKAWVHQEGATGAEGAIRSGACWRLPESNPTYMEHRVRLRDADGNWGEYVTTRLMLPATIAIEPSAVPLPVGGSQQFTVVVRDAANTVMPTDVVSWSNFNRPVVGSVNAAGLYTLAPNVVGLDNVYGWAGRAHAWSYVATQNAGAGESWWAPCWYTDLNLTQGLYRYYRMTVYRDVEYRFRLAGNPQGAPTGDADLFIRMGSRPTNTAYDAASDGTSFAEEIVWRAPSTGMVWIGIYAFENFTDVRFETPHDQCGFPGSALLAAEAPALQQVVAAAPPGMAAEAGPMPVPVFAGATREAGAAHQRSGVRQRAAATTGATAPPPGQRPER